MKTTLQTSAISSIDFTPEKRRTDIEWVAPKSWLGGLITRDGVYRWREDGRVVYESEMLRIGDSGEVLELALIEIHMTSGRTYYKRYKDSTLAEKDYGKMESGDLTKCYNIIIEDYESTRN